jgi:hypothetical protein
MTQITQLTKFDDETNWFRDRNARNHADQMLVIAEILCLFIVNIFASNFHQLNFVHEISFVVVVRIIWQNLYGNIAVSECLCDSSEICILLVHLQNWGWSG